MSYFSYVAIPCSDFKRASAFYNAITGGMLADAPNMPFPMAYFKDKEGKNVGHLFQFNGLNPGADGPLVYLNLTEDLNEIANKIPAAGGQVIMPKTMISSTAGYWAIFMDTEGNKLALHSMK